MYVIPRPQGSLQWTKIVLVNVYVDLEINLHNAIKLNGVAKILLFS